jgi:integrase
LARVLTDQFCRSVEPPQEGRDEYADLRCSGLAFRVTAAGVRTWAFRFRDPHTRKSSRSTIGAYPDIGLGKARGIADDLRAAVADGINPVEQERKQRAANVSRSFEAIAERYLIEHARRKKRSADMDERNLRLHVLPKWRNQLIDHIRRADVIELVEDLIADGKPALANRVHSLVSGIFGFCMDSDLLEANPCARLKKRGEENVGRRVLSDDELRLFWKRCVLSPVSRPTGLALRLQLVTGARPSEAAEARLSEFSNLEDPGRARWAIPGSRTKNSRDHLVPLSLAALDVVKAALELVGDAEKHLFPSRTNKGAPMEGHALAVAMRRLAESDDLIGQGAKSWKADPPTPHDLRRTFATRLSELGVSKQDRDACLNHIPTDVGSKYYDLYEREKEKRAAMTAWSDKLLALLGLRAA